MNNKFNQQEFENFVKQLIIQELKSKKIKENFEDEDEDLGIYSGDFNPDEFEGAAMQAAMTDIGDEFVPLGKSKFEKNLDPEEFKADLKRQNLLLPKDQEELSKIKQTLDAKKAHEKKFGAGTLNETGEWSDDEEGQAWIAGLQNELEMVQNMLAPGIPFIINDIQGFDKYQGPYANIHIAGDNYKVWTTDENRMWIENFPIDNTSNHGMRPGFEGDARQLAGAINTQYSVLSPIHMNEDFNEGPQPGDLEYHYQEPKTQKGIGKFEDIDWQVFYEMLLANTELYATGQVEGQPEYREANVSDIIEGFGMSREEIKVLEDHGIIQMTPTYSFKMANNVYPIIGNENFSDYNTFYEAAKSAWEKGVVISNDSSESPYLRGRELDEQYNFDISNLYKFLKDALYYCESEGMDYAASAQILEKALTDNFNITRKLNEGHVNPDTKIDRPKDAEGNPITLKARVETLDGSAAGRVMRFGVNDEGKMTVHVMWIGDFGGNIPNTITPIDQIVVRDKNRIVREDIDGNYMYKQNLNMLKDAAEVLLDKLNDDNMEDWAEDKIAKCTEGMRAVRDYYNHGGYEENDMKEGMGQSLAVGKGQNAKPANYPENRERAGLNESLDTTLQEVTHDELVNEWPGKKVKILIGPFADYPNHYGVIKTEDDYEFAHIKDPETGALVPKFGSSKNYKSVRKVGENEYDVDIDIFNADGKKVNSDTYAFDYLVPLKEEPVSEDIDYAAAEREHAGQAEMSDLNAKSQKYISEELQKFYVPNTFSITEPSPENGQFEYSYELRIPKQADETTKDIEKFVREEEGVYSGGPGKTFQKVSTITVLEKISNTWVVDVTVTRGYDV